MFGHKNNNGQVLQTLLPFHYNYQEPIKQMLWLLYDEPSLVKRITKRAHE